MMSFSFFRLFDLVGTETLLILSSTGAFSSATPKSTMGAMGFETLGLPLVRGVSFGGWYCGITGGASATVALDALLFLGGEKASV